MSCCHDFVKEGKMCDECVSEMCDRKQYSTCRKALTTFCGGETHPYARALVSAATSSANRDTSERVTRCNDMCPQR
jgi:hypothetical protein